MFWRHNMADLKTYYDNFVATLKGYDHSIIDKMSDSQIEQYVLTELHEKFNTWVTFDTFNKLQEAGYFSPLAGMEVSMLQMLYATLKGSQYWNAKSVRNNEGSWRMVFSYARSIVSGLNK